MEGGVIHVLDIPVTGEEQEFGYIATEKEFSNSGIHVEYKWGTKHFAPRAETPRDAGLLNPLAAGGAVAGGWKPVSGPRREDVVPYRGVRSVPTCKGVDPCQVEGVSHAAKCFF